MCWVLSMGYSTTIGTSGLILRITVGPKLLAFVKKLGYRSANVNSTGSSISIITWSSSFSVGPVWFLSSTFPVPRSPETENRTPFLVHEITHESSNTWRSRIMRRNSQEVILIVQWWEISGIASDEFKLKIRYTILRRDLEHECKSFCRVIGLKCNNVIVSSTLQNFAHISGVKSKTNGAVTSVMIKTIRLKRNLYEGQMWWVHCLYWDFISCAINICIAFSSISGMEREGVYFGVWCCGPLGWWVFGLGSLSSSDVEKNIREYVSMVQIRVCGIQIP